MFYTNMGQIMRLKVQLILQQAGTAGQTLADNCCKLSNSGGEQATGSLKPPDESKPGVIRFWSDLQEKVHLYSCVPTCLQPVSNSRV